MKKLLLPCWLILFNSCSCEDRAVNKSPQKIKQIKNQINTNNSNCPAHLMKRKSENLNISILLDVSDRIDLPNQQTKDSAYILLLANAFNLHVKDKKLGLLYDNIEVFFEPPPQNTKINTISQELKISYKKGVSKNEWLPKTTERYQSIPTQIYNLAREDAKSIGYPGSDIWGFFKNHVKDYCIEECQRNILVIITDGYMYHENSKRNNNNQTSYLTPQLLSGLRLNSPDWEIEVNKRNLGFIPATKGLYDLEVLVIGIQNQNGKHPYAQDIIKAYWGKWFDEMGVKKYKIKNADIPPSIEKVISDFILKV